MADRSAGTKAAPTRKLKKEHSAASLLPVSGELNVQICSLTPDLKLSHFR